ncbi:polyketide synthase [Aspergillus luchuensis]|uniref:Polyketide synthase n=1 Tax=Aspergillus kawachii TaxID=1069201 RepID=A0A146F6B0_ASPKA|nr:polyketide synthase [Aspergillus luchuensis]
MNSVNSFGFGGTNAHCILETYCGPPFTDPAPSPEGALPTPCCIPTVFSAASDLSLKDLLHATLAYLEDNTEVNICQLAYHMASKRSALPRRLALSAASVDDLRGKIKATLEASSKEDTNIPSILNLPGTASLLGVFTGQGAQWQGMGSQLISSIPLARITVEKLDLSLSSLPSYHRPSWTILDVLTDGTMSIGEASLSQPLCTAVQIIMVDLLQAAGIKFRAVVGHSSGEIAAAYAAGFITAWDAIRVAYYRGFYAKMAAGPMGEKGAMLAAGTTYEDARELCQLDDFNGRLCVAAHNSPTSVTLSGDLDAITQARAVLEEEEKFARVLKVDTAYHSAHMLRCAAPYLAALKDCNIQVQQPELSAPLWFSSVRKDQVISSLEGLDGQYWVDNMVQPVLFYPAVGASLSHEAVEHAINCGVEVGPHPALQVPVKDSIFAAVNQEIPYTGTLSRGKSSAVAFSEALGFLWGLFGPTVVKLGAFQQTNFPDTPTEMIRGLPT